MNIRTILILGAVFAVAWIGLYWIVPPSTFITWLQTGILTATALVVLYYTHETARIRQTAEDQIEEGRQTNEFEAYTRVHERLSNERSYRMRLRLHRPSFFPKVFAAVTREVLGTEYCNGADGVDVKRVVAQVAENHDQLNEFNRLLSDPGQLKPPMFFLPRVDFLEVVEAVLLDFDMIAGPLYRQNRAVQEAARIYDTIIRRTAPAIRPFVAVQMKLRGDATYKQHYRYLLDWLEIPLDGLPRPQAPSQG